MVALDLEGPGRRAIVGPGDARRQRLVVLVHRDQAVHRRAERDACDLVTRNMRAMNGAMYRRDDGGVDPVGILLGRAGDRRQQRVFDREFAERLPALFAIGDEHHRLGAGRADVHADRTARHGESSSFIASYDDREAIISTMR